VSERSKPFLLVGSSLTAIIVSGNDDHLRACVPTSPSPRAVQRA
jgi:hypothetical protein